MPSVKPTAVVPFSIKYAFSLKGEANPKPVGRTTAGTRIDLQYQPDKAGAIWTKPDRYPAAWLSDPATLPTINTWLTNVGIRVGAAPTYEEIRKFRTLKVSDVKASQWEKFQTTVAGLEKGTLYDLPWFGLEGTIESGSDWVLLRNDGVAEFSGRFTLRSADEDGALISAAFSGIVDAFKPDGKRTRDDTFSTPPPDSYKTNGLPLLLTATFDAAGAAPNWAPSRLRTQAAAFWKYQRLTQGQFIAVGKAKLEADSKYLVAEVDFDVYEVRPQ